MVILPPICFASQSSQFIKVSGVAHNQAMVIEQFVDVFLDANATEYMPRIGQECVERRRNAVGVEKLDNEAMLANAKLENGNGMVITGSKVGKPLSVDANEKFAVKTRAVNTANPGYPLMDVSSFFRNSNLDEFAMKIDRVKIWKTWQWG
ncbi:UNVERIFIED_CONTAM: hypothetical protein Sradi_5783800 [Sesamum radiatum]|uniref:Uncharacterized protein n=1 Tax=Sesamum radiatum TaxID=300843 RepID=A0AAW2KMY8_SESRA